MPLPDDPDNPWRPVDIMLWPMGEGPRMREKRPSAQTMNDYTPDPVLVQKLLDKFDFDALYLTLALVQPFTTLPSPDELRKKADALVRAIMIQHMLNGEQAVDGSYQPSGGFHVYCARDGIRLSFELCSCDITKDPDGEWK